MSGAQARQGRRAPSMADRNCRSEPRRRTGSYGRTRLGRLRLEGLQRVQTLIETGNADEVFVSAGLHDPPAVHDDDAIDVADRAEAVRDDEGRASLDDSAE